MGFDVAKYAKQKNPTETTGTNYSADKETKFDVAAYVKNKQQLQPVQQKVFTKARFADNGVDDWLSSIDTLQRSIDFRHRTMPNQPVLKDDDFAAYRDTIGGVVEALSGNDINSYRNFVNQNAAKYDETYGSGTAQRYLENIAKGEKYLADVTGILDEMQSHMSPKMFVTKDSTRPSGISTYKENVDVLKKLDEQLGIAENAPAATEEQLDNYAKMQELFAKAPRKGNLKDNTVNSFLRGYWNSKYASERYDDITYGGNNADKYKAMLEDDKFNFTSDGFGGVVSGAAELLGQQLFQLTNPQSAAMGAGAAGVAAAAGQMGPQLLLPEEIVTVPTAYIAGATAGSSLQNFKIEAAHAYDEMLENGISEDTAQGVANIVGVGNAALEAVQLDELIGAYKVLRTVNGDAAQSLAKRIGKVIIEFAGNVGSETAEEVAQEATTMTGVQAASLLDGKGGVYTAEEYLDRLAETAKHSALTFGLLNVPSAGISGYRAYRNAPTDALGDATLLQKTDAQEINEQVVQQIASEMEAKAIFEAAAQQMTEEADLASPDSAYIEEQQTNIPTEIENAEKGEFEVPAIVDFEPQETASVQPNAADIDVGAKDINVPDKTTENAAELVKRSTSELGLGETGINTAADMFNELDGYAPMEYVQEFTAFYNYGKNGYGFDQAHSNVNVLNDNQKRAAYNAGFMDAAKEKAALNKAPEKAIIKRARKADWSAHDVIWHATNPRTKKDTVIAYSTTATSDLVTTLSEEYPTATISEVKEMIGYDADAKKVLQAYIDSGFGNTVASDFFARNIKTTDNVTEAVKEDNYGKPDIPEIYDEGRILEPDTSGQSAGGLLDRISAEDVRTAEEGRQTVSDDRPAGRGTERPAGGTDEGRISGGRSLGGSERTDLQPSAREITSEDNNYGSEETISNTSDVGSAEKTGKQNAGTDSSRQESCARRIVEILRGRRRVSPPHRQARKGKQGISETLDAFEERAAKAGLFTYIDEDGTSFAFKYTTEDNISEKAKGAKRKLENWGFDVVVFDGELWHNSDNLTNSSKDAVTCRSLNTVFVSNNTVIGGDEIAYHEALHLARGTNNDFYRKVIDIIVDNSDYDSAAFSEFVNDIADLYEVDGSDLTDAAFERQMLEEVYTWYVGTLYSDNKGAMYNYMQAFSDIETASADIDTAYNSLLVSKETTPVAEDTASPAPLAADTVEKQIEQKAELATQENDKGNNFVYAEKGGIKIPTTEKARFKANVDAIKTLRNIKTENRRATPAEQEILAKYTGWGGVTNAFDENKADWAKESKQLKKLLTAEEYKTAKSSILDAYYTEPEIIRSMYKGLEKIGFKGGRLLEPSCGTGRFIGAMPQDMLGNVKSWSAVELDKITGSITKYLYPNADVRVQGFQDANIPDNYMDLVIGNVPFGDFGITDKGFPAAVTKRIHNYFIAKSIRKVRPGGIVCVITSKGTLDAGGTDARQQFMKEADLIGAIRLPNTAFKSTGTPVVSDILVFKKREANTPYKGEAFLDTQRVNAADYSYYGTMNEYFVNHPEMVLGKPVMERGRYGNDLTYVPLDSKYSLGVQIERAFAKITEKMEYPAAQDQREFIREIKAANSKTKNGAIVHKDGKFYKNTDGVLKEHSVNIKDADRLKGIISVRDGARQLLNLQLENASEKDIKDSRNKLNEAYDSFVKKYGYLNDNKNKKLFEADSERPFILSLENKDKDTGAVKKAEIFSKNTVTPIKVVTSADSVSEGLTVSLNEFGRIDVNRIAELTGESVQTVTDELVGTELAYFNRNGDLETAEQYLSGNVRAKLKDAKALAEGDERYKRNVAALEKIVPADIAAEDIKVRLGATWIPDDIYSQFATEKLGGGKDYRGNWDIRVSYNRQLGKFFVDTNSAYLKYRPENTTEWGTNERPLIGNDNNSLLLAALNNKQVNVYRNLDKDTRVIDKDATKAAQEKLAKLLTEFQEWLWRDEKRRTELGQMYNDIFNGTVTPKYDGSNLTVDGITPDPNRQMRPHQKSVVQRIINSGGNTLIAHRVGAGKTYEMSAAAMKLRQLGIVKKPVIIAPNHLVGQWGQEFLSYFPAAKILVVEKNDFSSANRKLFANRIATGDWDAVIMSYEQFEAVPMSDASQQAFYQTQIDNLEQAIIAAKRAENKDPSIRDMERSKRSFEEKLKKLAASSKKDKDNISFEELGIDALFVDEAHNFKNLFYTTKMNGVSDLGNKEGSARAFDLYSKVQYLQKLNGGRGIVFATATPVMNSAVEMYTMQRYLQADKLEAMGLSTFDAWANQFADIAEIDRYKASGKGIETKRSLARYKNLAELQQMFRSFADVITDAADLPYLKIPKMKGGKRIVVECEAGEFQKSFMEELGHRAEALRGKGGKYSKGDDHIFKIMGEGKMISFSQKMINPDMPYEARGKIMACVENVYSIWNTTTKVTGSGSHKADKGTQLIFCDRGVPGGTDAERGVNIYADMKNLLIGLGVPAEEIAFIHDADTDAKKTELFKNVNDGKVRILIGSSSKMGTGMNAQKRIVAIHELNAPDRPGDLEQLEGRGLRQGNLNDEVAIYAYITKGTFDASQWDRLKRKGTFIHQIMAGEYSGREADGDGEFALEAAEIAAIASDNPLILEHHQVSEKINTLSSLQRAHLKAVNDATRRIAKTKQDIAQYNDFIEKFTADINVRTDTSGDKFRIIVDGKTYTERKAGGDALIRKAKSLLKMSDNVESNTLVGNFAGFNLYVTSKGNMLLKGQAQYRKAVNMDSATGTIMSLEAAAKGIDKMLEATQNDLAEAKKALPKLEKAAAAPFEHAAELQQLITRENEIISILRPESENNQYVVDSEIEDSGSDKQYSLENDSDEERWTATRRGKADVKVKPISEIIAKASHDFGFHTGVGHLHKKNAAGQFSKRDKGINMKIANNLPTFCHELGHALEDRHNILAGTTEEMRKELLDNFAEDKKNLYPKKEQPFEALAEFVRKFTQDSVQAAADYPKFTDYFLSALGGKERAQIETLADGVNAYYSLDADTATSSIRSMEDKPYDPRTLTEKMSDFSNVFRQAWVDSMHSIKLYDEALGTHIYRKASNSLYSQNIAANILENELTDQDGKYIGKGLRQCLQGINLKDKKEFRLFGEYLVVKHGPERLKEGLRAFADDKKNTEEWMRKRQEALEQEYPQFIGASEYLYEFIANFNREWGVNSGIIAEESFNSWQKRWKYYVPFNRDVRDLDKYGRKISSKNKFANLPNAFKKAIGSGRDFINPVENLAANVVLIVNAAQKNRVMLDITDSAMAMGADAAFIEKVPDAVQAKHFDMTGVKEDLRDQLTEAVLTGEVSAGSFASVEEMIDNLDDVLTQYSRGNSKDRKVITVLRGGRREDWKINDPMLLETLANMTPGSRSYFLEGYGMITRFISSMTTGNNIVWSLFSNAPRDFMTVLAYGENKKAVKLLSDICISLANSFKLRYQDGKGLHPLYREYLAMGGGQSGVYNYDKNVAAQIRRRLAATESNLRKFNPIRFIEFVAEAIETGPRFATYKYLRETGYSAEEAFYAAMDVTVNFRRGGVKARELNKLFQFFNAGIQGSEKAYRYYIEAEDVPAANRKKIRNTRAATLLLTSIGIATLEYAINNSDDEKEKEYQQVSNYSKNTYILINVGDGRFFAIPKPRNLAVIETFVERLLEYTIGDNKHAFDEFTQYFTENTLPAIASDIAQLPANIAKDGLQDALGEVMFGVLGDAGIGGALVQVLANRDFLGRPIVSKAMEYTGYKNQYTGKTSKLAYAIGQTADISPVIVDHLGNQILSFPWGVQQALFPIDEKYRDVTLGVKNKYIKDNQYSQDIVNWLYDSRDKSATAKFDNVGDMEKVIQAKNDANMATFYSNYNKLAKNEKETPLNRGTRQAVLDMLYDYRAAYGKPNVTPVYKAVYDVVKQTGSAEYMPDVKDITIKDGDGRIYSLTSREYYDYQTKYLNYYWSYVGKNLNLAANIKEKASVISVAKAVASQRTDEYMLNKKGSSTGYFDDYSGIDDGDVIEFNSRIKIDTDGTPTQQEIIDIVALMVSEGLEYEDAYTLFHSKYDSDKNNPWRYYKP